MYMFTFIRIVIILVINIQLLIISCYVIMEVYYCYGLACVSDSSYGFPTYILIIMVTLYDTTSLLENVMPSYNYRPYCDMYKWSYL